MQTRLEMLSKRLDERCPAALPERLRELDRLVMGLGRARDRDHGLLEALQDRLGKHVRHIARRLDHLEGLAERGAELERRFEESRRQAATARPSEGRDGTIRRLDEHERALVSALERIGTLERFVIEIAPDGE